MSYRGDVEKVVSGRRIADIGRIAALISNHKYTRHLMLVAVTAVVQSRPSRNLSINWQACYKSWLDSGRTQLQQDPV